MKKDLKQEILDKIKKGNIKPISKEFFSWKNRFLWIIILLIISLLGVSFSFFYNDLIDLKEIGCFTTNNRLLFIPNIFWFAVIISLILIGFIYFRKTKYGYKQSTFVVLSITLIITIFLGSFFIFTNFSRYFQNSLISNSKTLQTYIYREDLWNKPDEGRLIGTIKNKDIDGIILKDIEGKIWKIDTKNSFIGKNVDFKDSEKIRIIGKLISGNTFEASKVIPYFGMGGLNGMRLGEGKKCK